MLTPEERAQRNREGVKKYYAKNKEYRDACKQRAKEQYAKDPAANNLRFRNDRLKREYGITHEKVKEMFIAQGGLCAICANKMSGRLDICVDHNHTTKQVRQLLCRKCNSGLGQFKENPTIMARAIEYVNKWNV